MMNDAQAYLLGAKLNDGILTWNEDSRTVYASDAMMDFLKQNQKSFQQQLEYYTNIAFDNQKDFFEWVNSPGLDSLTGFYMNNIEIMLTIKSNTSTVKITRLTSSFIEWADEITTNAAKIGSKSVEGGG